MIHNLQYVGFGILVAQTLIMGFYAIEDILHGPPSEWVSTKHLWPFLLLAFAAGTWSLTLWSKS